jgi:hypothetical protein
MKNKYDTNSFIRVAAEIHKNKYDYSKSEYTTISNKITIICPNHGEFKQEAKYHLKGGGCYQCAKESRKTPKTSIETFIEKARKIFGNNYCYDEVNYINTLTKVKIICKEHGSFEQKPVSHLSGSGCRLCFHNRKTSSNDQFIDKAIKIHGNKYSYLLSEYKNNKSNIKILCPIHGEFVQQAAAHLRGANCPSCSRKTEKIAGEFFNKVNQLYKNKYDYSLSKYKNNREKIIIICPIHGQFTRQPCKHLVGYGCSRCGKYAKLSNNYFIERAVELHGDKYDYSNINITSNKSIARIICKIHGEFNQEAGSHLKGSGCSGCSGTKKLDTNIFIKRSKKIHGDKYDYSLSKYVGINKKVKIICKEHGEFLQIANNHMLGGGCPKCGVSCSKDEISWIKSFNNLNIISGYDKLIINNKKLKPDGFDPTTNTVYEFYGDYWHGNPKKFKSEDINPSNNISFGELYKKTIKRANMIKMAGYNLVSIWEYDYRKSLCKTKDIK